MVTVAEVPSVRFGQLSEGFEEQLAGHFEPYLKVVLSKGEVALSEVGPIGIQSERP
jgi:hypothetical protein